MYAQLGTTIFDGLKSFVTFSQEEEAILVEHALIGRKPRLEGSGLGLRTLTINLFLHQEFCKVEDEIAKLRNSKDTFEILQLIWGNGKVEGKFVIKQMNHAKTQQDELGNTYSASVDLILKESVEDNELDRLQINAVKNAFAVGKNPATKSKRINEQSCDKKVANNVSVIRNFGGACNTDITTRAREKAIGNVREDCTAIINNCAQIIVATETANSCVSENIPLRTAADNVRAAASELKDNITDFHVDYSVSKDNNTILQGAIKKLCAVASDTSAKSVIR